MRLHVAAVAVSVLAALVAGFSAPAGLGSEKGAAYPTSWSPTAGLAPRTAYAGSNVCSECHTNLAATKTQTPMGQAAALPRQPDLLHNHTELTYQAGPYRYAIRRQGYELTYSVSDGQKNLSEPIQYVFGYGMKGQTYVFMHDGSYYESRVSYYAHSRGLDITFGLPTDVPASLELALGHRLSPDDARLCFACHNTAAVTNGRLDPSSLMPGVGCEACHGPGADHVAAMKAAKFENPHIFNPGRLEPDDLVNFCGSCHRTWEQVMRMQVFNVRNVRFQPYRLINSKCWNPTDARSSCLACHDPHQPLREDVSYYDSKCFACHAAGRGAGKAGKLPGRACPVSKKNCVTCHMPKVTLPEGESDFTDHWIRIVRKGEPYPN